MQNNSPAPSSAELFALLHELRWSALRLQREQRVLAKLSRQMRRRLAARPQEKESLCR